MAGGISPYEDLLERKLALEAVIEKILATDEVVYNEGGYLVILTGDDSGTRTISVELTADENDLVQSIDRALGRGRR